MVRVTYKCGCWEKMAWDNVPGGPLPDSERCDDEMDAALEVIASSVPCQDCRCEECQDEGDLCDLAYASA